MTKTILFVLLSVVCSSLHVLARDGPKIPGFISIDCGSERNYTDVTTTIPYTTDTGFTEFGQNENVSSSYLDLVETQQSINMRIFPYGARNCYTLRPDEGKNNVYLIRAFFESGDKDEPPMFDLYIDTNLWAKVNTSFYTNKEVVYVPQRDYIHVCLVNTGDGDPFISALELRLIGASTYAITSGAMMTFARINIGSRSSYRHPEDDHDRIWRYRVFTPWLSTSTANQTAINMIRSNNNAFEVPAEVLATAQEAVNSSVGLKLGWESPVAETRWLVYLHFTEVELISNSNRSRAINVSIADNFVTTVNPEYLKPVTVGGEPFSGAPNINITLSAASATANLPPFLNALEIFKVLDLSISMTELDDFNAVIAIKEIYQLLQESWQGDPCLPLDYTWNGLNCSQDDPPRIVSMNLSSSGLSGPISPSFSDLTELVSLDMSHNQLTGQIPEFLGKLPNLKVLNLSGNNLSGSIPKTIQKKMADKSLNLNVSGNQNMCLVSSCQPNRMNKKKNGFMIPVIAAIATLMALLLIVLAIIWRVRNRKENGQSGSATIQSKNRSFSYNEVLRITENSKTVIGEGGFGKVYLGTLADGSKVAVKMLSQSSNQGYLEFQSEAQLLTVVHHRNLVSLVGYCDDSQNMVLIYEFMERGNVREHLSGENNPNILTWNERMRIALDAAQGLDYLQNGCKPPIIHRDMKTSNILLNENMQAKIADFGLSKAFATENDSYIMTRPAGTPGYLDPEFQNSGNLNRKSDVYSFGIILLELVTGHPPIMRTQRGNIHILQWVNPIVESGDIQRIVDPQLNGQFNKNSAWKVVEIAMCCASMNIIQRPDISRVLGQLKECWDMEMAVDGRLTTNNSFEVVASGKFANDYSAPMPR